MIEELISRSLILALGYAYPAYLCFKTLEKNRVAIQDLRFWCQYWVIVAVLAVLENFSDILISWLPMYRVLKLGLYIYLWHPSTKGSENVYENLLRPHLLMYEEHIDRSLFEAKERALNLLQNAGKEAANVPAPPPPPALPVPPQPATPPTTPSATTLRRNTSEKWRPPVPHSTTPHSLPKSESMKVRLLGQTQFIHPQDFLPDQDVIEEISSDSEHEDSDKIKSH